MKRIVVLSGPSGVGKSTLEDALLSMHPKDFVKNPTYTTRAPRHHETDGRDYHFITVEDFLEKLEAKFFIDDTMIYDHYYGISLQNMEQWFHEDKTILMILDLQGYLSLKNLLPDEILGIYIEAPNKTALKERMQKRGDEDSEIEKRLANYIGETDWKRHYDGAVVNEQISTTIQAVLDLIRKHQV